MTLALGLPGRAAEPEPGVSAAAEEWLNQSEPLPKLLGARPDKSKVCLLVRKSEYRLTLLYDGRPIKDYPVVFGLEKGGPDKLRQGDRCTPEGRFRIRGAYPHKAWSKFLWLDYPNEQSWRKYKAAKQDGRIPGSADIGGEIGIHGVPAGLDAAIEQRQDWTLGCISLRNADIDEIYRVVGQGTAVEIRP